MNTFGHSEEEMRLLATWRGEAAKEWFQKLDEAGRKKISELPPSELFVLGWMCCKAKQLTSISS